MSISPNELAKALSAAEHWAVHDPDPQTKNEAIGLINLVTLGEPSAEEAIVAQFGERLAFGTAGLRGEIGAGPSRMNKMVVMQTSAALAKWLWNRSELGSASNPPSIVVGFDARTKSDVFARAAAEVFMGAGLRTILLPGPLPTPLTAFAVKHLDVSAGVMITASHNPPKDNGYKVFLGDSDCGSQIAAPADQEISEIIAFVAASPIAEIPLQNDYEFAGDEIITAYINAFKSDWVAPQVKSDLTVVYTALHGVGSTVTQQLFAELGLPKLHTVDSQDTPDGSFPTVAFPNPEEPGALDEAYSKAREVGADLIIAHDPDADRLAVALPDSESAAGFSPLTGNQLGLLLGWQAAQQHSAAGKAGGTLACTIVSSPALSKIATAYGLNYAETLSGFKWVSRVPGLIFGFEEALGYLSRPNLVKDKDGISASADLLKLALDLHAEGKTLRDKLADAAEKFGSFASTQVTVRLATVAAVLKLTEIIRGNPPTHFDGVKVEFFTDLLNPDLLNPDLLSSNSLTSGGFSQPANVLKFMLEDGSRVMIRPSGTEPKLKLYLDTFSDEGSVVQRTTAAKEALERLEAGVRSTLGI